MIILKMPASHIVDIHRAFLLVMTFYIMLISLADTPQSNNAMINS